MKENMIVELVSKITYYVIVFLLYKLFGFEAIVIYLLACLNTKLTDKVYRR